MHVDFEVFPRRLQLRRWPKGSEGRRVTSREVEVSALEGLAFFDCELAYPRREHRPAWTTPSASLLVALQPEEASKALKRSLSGVSGRRV